MSPFQQRVIEEEAELSAKVDKLDAFTVTAPYVGLPRAERTRLQRQLSYMMAYRGVLRERIEAFNVAGAPCPNNPAKMCVSPVECAQRWCVESMAIDASANLESVNFA